MKMYEYIMSKIGKYENIRDLSFYESICGDLCSFCKHHDKKEGGPSWKCTNRFCNSWIEKIMKDGPEEGNSEKEEQISLF